MQVRVQISNYLRLSPQDISAPALEALKGALTVFNDEKPDDPPVVMWGLDSVGMFCVPRGFAIKLRKGLARFGFEVQWLDDRVRVPINVHFADTSFKPFSYQETAIERMLSCEQGIYEAPPGSGKTISACFFISMVRQKTIILVDKINIADQWQTRIRESLGYEAGIIGDGRWEEKDITIATRHSIYAKRHELRESGFFKRFGCVFLDECHAVSAQSVRAVMQEFYAYYMIGLSATPDRHEWLTLVSRSIIGEIFCRTTDRELEAAGRLVRPKIVAVRTNFKWPWKRGKDPRSQWAKMLKDLKFDPERNTLIMEVMKSCRGHSCLVHTDQKGHAHELAAYALAAGWPDESVLMLTGDQKSEERSRVIERAAEGDCIIFSTIGQEAMDIPRLSRFLMPFPTKNVAMVKQMVGRLKRPHKDKGGVPIVYDFFDYQTSVLASHFASRRTAYARDELELQVL